MLLDIREVTLLAPKRKGNRAIKAIAIADHGYQSLAGGFLEHADVAGELRRTQLTRVQGLHHGSAELLVLVCWDRARPAVAYLQHVSMTESPALLLVSAWRVRTMAALGLMH